MFSKTCKYGIRAVLYLAVNSGEDEKLGLEQIAENLSVPKPFLAKLLQQLTKNRLISSTKGRNGGYYLSDSNKSSNLMRVIESFDGKETFTQCVIGLKDCSNSNPCPYHNEVQKYRNSFFRKLREETIEESAIRIKKHDYTIQNN